mmetsp:Transcript_27276/g.79493  ORF Transcript_27276/g.79493 Transcript_27276/m.79493 type:complete len:244 (-) Transcript_27276:1519-2250(-)
MFGGLGVSAQVFQGGVRDASGIGPLLELEVRRLDKGHGAVHVAVAIAHETSIDTVDVDALAVGGLHRLDGNVLAALELDQVLESVHDLEHATLGPHGNITGVEPAVGVELLTSLLLHHVVAARHGRTADPDLTASRAGFAQMFTVRVQVRLAVAVQDLRAVVQPNLDGLDRGARNRVLDGPEGLHCARCARLREAVALNEVHIESDAHEVLDVWGQGATTRDTELESASEHLVGLLEDQVAKG